MFVNRIEKCNFLKIIICIISILFFDIFGADDIFEIWIVSATKMLFLIVNRTHRTVSKTANINISIWMEKYSYFDRDWSLVFHIKSKFLLILYLKLTSPNLHIESKIWKILSNKNIIVCCLPSIKKKHRSLFSVPVLRICTLYMI